MSDFFEAKSLTPEEQKRLAEEVQRVIAEKIKDGTVIPREIREIEEMRLQPLADIQDVQSVYEHHLFEDRPSKGGGHEPGK
jgi:hypothetical protein